MAMIGYELRDGIAHVTLTRPEKRNAMCDAMVEELEIAAVRAMDEARAVVIAGQGDHFCAGLDLGEHIDLGAPKVRPAIEHVLGSRNWHRVFQRIRSGPIPWFAALHGGVIGGGMELAAVAHVRVADESAFFALPEGQRGIFVGGSGSVFISRLISVARMMDLMLTGRVLSAAEAERIDMVTYVVPKGDALGKAVELAQKSMTNAAFSNYCIINGLPRIREAAVDEGLFFESMLAAFTQTNPEAHDRLAAFLEGRADRIKPGAKAG